MFHSLLLVLSSLWLLLHHGSRNSLRQGHRAQSCSLKSGASPAFNWRSSPNSFSPKRFCNDVKRYLKGLAADKVFDKSQNYIAGRVERVQTALAQAKRLQQLNVRHKWTQDEFMTANELISEPGPYGLHASMFLITLRDQGLRSSTRSS